jgi:hypothetical protein
MLWADHEVLYSSERHQGSQQGVAIPLEFPYALFAIVYGLELSLDCSASFLQIA